MRWEIYVSQTLAAGQMALAALVLLLGIFSWWYVIQRSAWLARWRRQLTAVFWSLLTGGYLSFFGWLCFGFPG